MYNECCRFSALIEAKVLSSAIGNPCSGGISYVFNPFEATYTYIIGQSSQDAGSTTPATPAKSNGVLKNAVSVSGIRVLSGSGTYGTIRVRVYGVTR